MNPAGNESLRPDTDTTRAVRLGLFGLILGFVVFLVWAAFAPLDAGVPANGVVAVSSKRKTVDHLSGGIVAEIRVKEGDTVAQGQVLLRLVHTQAEAQQAIIRSQLISARAVEARLLAERSRAATVVYGHPLLQERNDPTVRSAIETQDKLFHSRRGAHQAGLSALSQSIEGVREEIQGMKALEEGKKQQLALLREEQNSQQELFRKGYISRNRMLELERSIAEIGSRQGEHLANIARARTALTELSLRRQEREDQFLQAVEGQLAEVQKECEKLDEQLRAVSDELARTDIRAPASGVVVGLAVHTVGGVVRGGQALMDIVPEGEPFVIEAQVRPQLIEKVARGMPVLVRFSALDKFNPVLNGQVEVVSADRLVDQRTGASYYAARIVVPPEELSRLTYSKIAPGMPVDVVIKTGERSLLRYLLGPLFDQLFLSLKEP